MSFPGFRYESKRIPVIWMLNLFPPGFGLGTIYAGGPKTILLLFPLWLFLLQHFTPGSAVVCYLITSIAGTIIAAVRNHDMTVRSNMLLSEEQSLKPVERSRDDDFALNTLEVKAREAERRLKEKNRAPLPLPDSSESLSLDPIARKALEAQERLEARARQAEAERNALSLDTTGNAYFSRSVPEPEPAHSFEPEPAYSLEIEPGEPDPAYIFEPEPEPEPEPPEPEPEPAPIYSFEAEPEPEPSYIFETEPEPEPEPAEPAPIYSFEAEPEPEPSCVFETEPEAEPEPLKVEMLESALSSPGEKSGNGHQDAAGLRDLEPYPADAAPASPVKKAPDPLAAGLGSDFYNFELPSFETDFKFDFGNSFDLGKIQTGAPAGRDHCQRCGASVQTDFSFCLSCGLSFDSAAND